MTVYKEGFGLGPFCSALDRDNNRNVTEIYRDTDFMKIKYIHPYIYTCDRNR